MKIVHITTFGQIGGAAIAASRLHAGLLARGHDSTMVTREDASNDPAARMQAVGDCEAPRLTPAELETVFYTAYARADRPFTTDLPTRDCRRLATVQHADVINVHWAAGFLSTPSLRALQDLGKPVVWTLHDQYAFTGGCHYSGSCREYERECGGCQYLAPDARHLPRLILRRKADWLDAGSLSVVCPSDWLAGRARRSALLQSSSVSTIHNGIDVRRFQCPDRADARARLGIAPDAVVLLAGSHRLDEPRKGHRYLAEALAILASDPRLHEPLANRQIVCLAFGEGDFDTAIPTQHVGRVSGDGELARIYRAADVFVLPTLEDNLPNTLLEAAAAGTPIVGFRTGGVPEVVERGQCGLLVPAGDARALADSLRLLIDDAPTRRRLGERGDAFARAHLDLAHQCGSYLRLYEAVIDSTRAFHRPCAVSGPFDRAVVVNEAQLFRDAAANPRFAERMLGELTAELHDSRQLIDARGGEIQSLRDELALTRDSWRVTRETLHQASGFVVSLTAERDRACAELQSAGDERARLAAERAALQRRMKRLMTKAVIVGSSECGRRLWEAVVAAGPVDVVAIIDTDPRKHGRTVLGHVVKAPAWLRDGHWDVVVVGDTEAASCPVREALTGVPANRIVVIPDSDDMDVMSRLAATRFPDPLSRLTRPAAARAGIRVGIFGTGSAAMKVWEALAEIDETDTAWFADNNPDQQGRTFLWVDIIAPSEIHRRGCDVLVIGSMSRDPIRRQLNELGISDDRILTPNVAGSVDQIRQQLASCLSRREPQDVLR